MKAKYAKIFLTLACVSNVVLAQNVGSRSAPPAPQPSNINVNHSPSAGALDSGTFERTTDKIFDVNSDSFNLEDGTLNWKGKTFNVGNSRFVKARFERYLAMDSSKDGIDSYEAILNEITSQLAANNDDLDEAVLRRVWDRLFDAAEYPIDADASLATANMVYLSWRMRDEYRIFSSDEKNKQTAADRERKLSKEKAEFFEYADDKMRRRSGTRTSAIKNARTEGKSAIAHQAQDASEALAELAAAKITKEAAGVKAVMQFQSQIFAFMMERKFQNAQIASMFYRHIYRGNAQDLRVGKDEIQALFPSSQFLPTVDMMEGMARELRSDIRKGMGVVENLYARGDKYTAMERLMETFAIGENDYYMLTFAYEKKHEINKIYRLTSTLKELADSKDWGEIENVILEIGKITSDFPSREVLAKSRAAMSASNMSLLAAKQAAFSNDKVALEKNLTKAMELWPLNPGIDSFSSEMVQSALGASKYTEKFDELADRGNYREITEEAATYGMAFIKDKPRQNRLKEIVSKISQIDLLVAQADEFEKQKNPYFAWDILDKAQKIDPEDPTVARARARLAPEVADYVKMINLAEKAEKNQNWANSLNYYLSAQEIFPASQICREGISRVADKYVP